MRNGQGRKKWFPSALAPCSEGVGGELRVLSAPLMPGGWAGVPQFLFSFTVLTCLQKFNFRTWEMYFFLVVLSKLF